MLSDLNQQGLQDRAVGLQLFVGAVRLLQQGVDCGNGLRKDEQKGRITGAARSAGCASEPASK